MNRTRTVVLAASALLLAAPVAVLAPADAAAARKAQVVTFTSAAPTGAVFNQTSDLGDYVPSAKSTSGLPVRLSVDPASNACSATPGVIGEPANPNRITVHWNAPGTCRIFADQAGNKTYKPATRVVQSIVIAREPVTLTAAPANKGLLGLTATTFRAELTHQTRFGPGSLTVGYGDQPISFSVGGKVLCTATTVLQGDLFNSTAVATCKAPIGLANALATSTYTATYAGNQLSVAATASAKLG